MLKGFMIFFTATAWLVSWSFAELPILSVYGSSMIECRDALTKRDRKRPCQLAAGRCTCTDKYCVDAHWKGLQATCW